MVISPGKGSYEAGTRQTGAKGTTQPPAAPQGPAQTEEEALLNLVAYGPMSDPTKPGMAQTAPVEPGAPPFVPAAQQQQEFFNRLAEAFQPAKEAYQAREDFVPPEQRERADLGRHLRGLAGEVQEVPQVAREEVGARGALGGGLSLLRRGVGRAQEVVPEVARSAVRAQAEAETEARDPIGEESRADLERLAAERGEARKWETARATLEKELGMELPPELSARMRFAEVVHRKVFKREHTEGGITFDMSSESFERQEAIEEKAQLLREKVLASETMSDLDKERRLADIEKAKSNELSRLKPLHGQKWRDYYKQKEFRRGVKEQEDLMASLQDGSIDQYTFNQQRRWLRTRSAQRGADIDTMVGPPQVDKPYYEMHKAKVLGERDYEVEEVRQQLEGQFRDYAAVMWREDPVGFSKLFGSTLPSQLVLRIDKDTGKQVLSAPTREPKLYLETVSQSLKSWRTNRTFGDGTSDNVDRARENKINTIGFQSDFPGDEGKRAPDGSPILESPVSSLVTVGEDRKARVAKDVVAYVQVAYRAKTKDKRTSIMQTSSGERIFARLIPPQGTSDLDGMGGIIILNDADDVLSVDYDTRPFSYDKVPAGVMHPIKEIKDGKIYIEQQPGLKYHGERDPLERYKYLVELATAGASEAQQLPSSYDADAFMAILANEGELYGTTIDKKMKVIPGIQSDEMPPPAWFLPVVFAGYAMTANSIDDPQTQQEHLQNRFYRELMEAYVRGQVPTRKHLETFQVFVSAREKEQVSLDEAGDVWAADMGMYRAKFKLMWADSFLPPNERHGWWKEMDAGDWQEELSDLIYAGTPVPVAVHNSLPTSDKWVTDEGQRIFPIDDETWAQTSERPLDAEILKENRELLKKRSVSRLSDTRQFSLFNFSNLVASLPLGRSRARKAIRSGLIKTKKGFRGDPTRLALGRSRDAKIIVANIAQNPDAVVGSGNFLTTMDFTQAILQEQSKLSKAGVSGSWSEEHFAAGREILAGAHLTDALKKIAEQSEVYHRDRTTMEFWSDQSIAAQETVLGAFHATMSIGEFLLVQPVVWSLGAGGELLTGGPQFEAAKYRGGVGSRSNVTRDKDGNIVVSGGVLDDGSVQQIKIRSTEDSKVLGRDRMHGYTNPSTISRVSKAFGSLRKEQQEEAFSKIKAAAEMMPFMLDHFAGYFLTPAEKIKHEWNYNMLGLGLDGLAFATLVPTGTGTVGARIVHGVASAPEKAFMKAGGVLRASGETGAIKEFLGTTLYGTGEVIQASREFVTHLPANTFKRIFRSMVLGDENGQLLRLAFDETNYGGEAGKELAQVTDSHVRAAKIQNNASRQSAVDTMAANTLLGGFSGRHTPGTGARPTTVLQALKATLDVTGRVVPDAPGQVKIKTKRRNYETRKVESTQEVVVRVDDIADEIDKHIDVASEGGLSFSEALEGIAKDNVLIHADDFAIYVPDADGKLVRMNLEDIGLLRAVDLPGRVLKQVDTKYSPRFQRSVGRLSATGYAPTKTMRKILDKKKGQIVEVHKYVYEQLLKGDTHISGGREFTNLQTVELELPDGTSAIVSKGDFIELFEREGSIIAVKIADALVNGSIADLMPGGSSPIVYRMRKVNVVINDRIQEQMFDLESRAVAEKWTRDKFEYEVAALHQGPGPPDENRVPNKKLALWHDVVLDETGLPVSGLAGEAADRKVFRMDEVVEVDLEVLGLVERGAGGQWVPTKKTKSVFVESQAQVMSSLRDPLDRNDIMSTTRALRDVLNASSDPIIVIGVDDMARLDRLQIVSETGAGMRGVRPKKYIVDGDVQSVASLFEMMGLEPGAAFARVADADIVASLFPDGVEKRYSNTRIASKTHYGREVEHVEQTWWGEKKTVRQRDAVDRADVPHSEIDLGLQRVDDPSQEGAYVTLYHKKTKKIVTPEDIKAAIQNLDVDKQLNWPKPIQEIAAALPKRRRSAQHVRAPSRPLTHREILDKIAKTLAVSKVAVDLKSHPLGKLAFNAVTGPENKARLVEMLTQMEERFYIGGVDLEAKTKKGIVTQKSEREIGGLNESRDFNLKRYEVNPFAAVIDSLHSMNHFQVEAFMQWSKGGGLPPIAKLKDRSTVEPTTMQDSWRRAGLVDILDDGSLKLTELGVLANMYGLDASTHFYRSAFARAIFHPNTLVKGKAHKFVRWEDYLPGRYAAYARIGTSTFNDAHGRLAYAWSNHVHSGIYGTPEVLRNAMSHWTLAYQSFFEDFYRAAGMDEFASRAAGTSTIMKKRKTSGKEWGDIIADAQKENTPLVVQDPWSASQQAIRNVTYSMNVVETVDLWIKDGIIVPGERVVSVVDGKRTVSWKAPGTAAEWVELDRNALLGRTIDDLEKNAIIDEVKSRKPVPPDPSLDKPADVFADELNDYLSDHAKWLDELDRTMIAQYGPDMSSIVGKDGILFRKFGDRKMFIRRAQAGVLKLERDIVQKLERDSPASMRYTLAVGGDYVVRAADYLRTGKGVLPTFAKVFRADMLFRSVYGPIARNIMANTLFMNILAPRALTSKAYWDGMKEFRGKYLRDGPDPNNPFQMAIAEQRIVAGGISKEAYGEIAEMVGPSHDRYITSVLNETKIRAAEGANTLTPDQIVRLVEAQTRLYKQNLSTALVERPGFEMFSGLYDENVPRSQLRTMYEKMTDPIGKRLKRPLTPRAIREPVGRAIDRVFPGAPDIDGMVRGDVSVGRLSDEWREYLTNPYAERPRTSIARDVVDFGTSWLSELRGIKRVGKDPITKFFSNAFGLTDDGPKYAYAKFLWEVEGVRDPAELRRRVMKIWPDYERVTPFERAGTLISPFMVFRTKYWRILGEWMVNNPMHARALMLVNDKYMVDMMSDPEKLKSYMNLPIDKARSAHLTPFQWIDGQMFNLFGPYMPERELIDNPVWQVPLKLIEGLMEADLVPLTKSGLSNWITNPGDAIWHTGLNFTQAIEDHMLGSAQVNLQGSLLRWAHRNAYPMGGTGGDDAELLDFVTGGRLVKDFAETMRETIHGDPLTTPGQKKENLRDFRNLLIRSIFGTGPVAPMSAEKRAERQKMLADMLDAMVSDYGKTETKKALREGKRVSELDRARDRITMAADKNAIKSAMTLRAYFRARFGPSMSPDKIAMAYEYLAAELVGDWKEEWKGMARDDESIRQLMKADPEFFDLVVDRAEKKMSDAFTKSLGDEHKKQEKLHKENEKRQEKLRKEKEKQGVKGSKPARRTRALMRRSDL